MATTKGQRLQFELDDDDLKLFCEEADEQIELLDSSLVQLEGEPDPELVQQIFRAAHTLKGSSATIGHKKMASLTHAMETVLDAVRQGRKTANAEMVDALLAGLDALRILANEVVTRVDSGSKPPRSRQTSSPSSRRMSRKLRPKPPQDLRPRTSFRSRPSKWLLRRRARAAPST